MSTQVGRVPHPTQPQTFEDALALDTREVPEQLRRKGIKDIGPMEIPTEWYLDRSIHEQEVERIWKKVWQVACREDDISEVGDTFLYEIANISIVLVRTSKTQIKGFYNACLHRGTALRKCAGRVTQLQCPFHGFTWGLDGALRFIPARENFPNVKPEDFRLPEVQVGRWGGFVFINPDLNAKSLESYLGDFGSHFDRYPFDERVKFLHVAKVFNCNWKVLQEAFMEAWHVLTTHPQQARSHGERGHTVDVWGNYSRGILVSSMTSDYIRETPTAQQVYQEALGRWDDAPDLPALPAGMSPRTALANHARQYFREQWGDKLDRLCDSEIVDIPYFTLFPNFHPFGSIRGLVYQARPHKDDHTRSVLDLMMFLPGPRSGERPLPAKVRWLTDDEDFSAVPELGPFGAFVSQDIANLEQITKGLQNNRRRKVVFAKYQELKIRHFYALWQRAMGISAEEDR